MSTLLHFLSGGHFVGHRTQILSAVGVIVALANWAIGDASATDTVNAIWQAVASLSVGTLGAKINRAVAMEDDEITVDSADYLRARDAALVAEVWDLARGYGDRPARSLPQGSGEDLLEWVHMAREEAAR